MTKFFVKKPFFVVVAVIIILIIGGVNLSNMNTDLMPDMEIPYMMVVTTEPGASPEKVESDVTAPMESALGTVNGVENVISSSANNYSMVMLEFADDTDMDSALVRVSKVIDTISLPDGCGTPNLMEVSMDMMATMYAGIDYEGKDIKELSDFTTKTLKPYLERQEGVASITTMGLTADSIEIRLNQDKIDKINDKILGKTNEKLSDAGAQIEEAEKKIEEGESQLKGQESKLNSEKDSTNKKLADAQVKLSQAQATKTAYEANLNSLKAGRSALEAEKKAYEDANLEDTYQNVDKMFATFNQQFGTVAKASGVMIPSDVEDAVKNKKSFQKFADWVNTLGYGEQLEELSYDRLKQMYEAVKVRIPQIDTELANLKTKIAAAEAVVEQMEKQMEGMDKTQSDTISGGYSAAAAFGAGQAQMSSAQAQLEASKEELEEAKTQLENSREAAIENSNIDTLLSLETLSQLITAQNFSMPAGYIDDEDDNQWLVDVGDNYTSKKQLTSMVLTKVPGVGKIKLSDVADVTVVDNAGESYSKIDGNPAVLLAIYKSSTANTSAVSGNVTETFRELEDKYEGLSCTALMAQSEYIDIIISTVLQSMLMGALLAVLVLALFLKAVKPTLIVAFSIPFSVLFAIVIMYFTGITLNVMSLAGLCLGIGMLVDNSIVVMENIYRLRNMGISAPRAAVQGTKQVAAPIVASTLTTICVFLPLVYVEGTVRQLLIPFAFTMTYTLVASLIVALTVVPTIGASILKNAKDKEHKWFDQVKEAYGRLLTKCLRHKLIPLLISIILLVVCVVQVFRTGLVLLDDMSSNSISVSLKLEEDIDKDTAYETADQVMNAIMEVDGVKKVGAMDGNVGAATGITGGSTDSYSQFTFQIIADEDRTTTDEFEEIIRDIEEGTKNIPCEELTVSSSALGSMGSMMSQGLEVRVYGENQERLIDISQDVMDMMSGIEGTENVENGVSDDEKQLHLTIDKNKAAEYGLTVAQIYQQLSEKITTEKSSITITSDNKNYEVNIVNDNKKPSYENLLNTTIQATTKDSEGNDVTKKYKLSKFAKATEQEMLKQITRENQTGYISVTSEVKEGYNAALLSRDLEEKLNSYEMPEGYTAEIQGESEQVMEMIHQLLLAILLGLVLVYLVMVAQFQSLLSPFIILFTVPLAFTGGMIGLMLFGKQISAMALMGFMILMGTVVNNGIVFVDYVNKLRLQGIEKRAALIATGKTRMRPILMTAMTTILSMSVMVFSQDAGNAMQKSMAIVVSFGLLYATLMTLFIVPILYDMMYRKQPKVIDVGDDNLDDIPDEAAEVLAEMEEK